MGTLSVMQGDLVLAPFCGCGTTIDAAEKPDRDWFSFVPGGTRFVFVAC